MKPTKGALFLFNDNYRRRLKEELYFCLPNSEEVNLSIFYKNTALKSFRRTSF